MIKSCLICKKDFKTKPSHYARRKYCSCVCFNLARKETLKGANNPCWRGGLPKCADCGKDISRSRKRCNPCRRAFARQENHYNWQGGITKISVSIRNSFPYKQWRKSVFERDKYTCQECGQVGGKLEADHIKPFAYFPESRLSLENGRTLCHQCHKKTDTYLSKARKKKLCLTLV